MQLSIGEVVVKLREFGTIMNDEVGEAVLSMCNLYSYSDYLSDEFYKALEKEMKDLLNLYQTNYRIVEKEEQQTVKWKEIEDIDHDSV